MPLYEYECGRCGATIEVKQRMDDPPFTTHAQAMNLDPNICNGVVERKISASSLKFIGSGFYVNDYRKNQTR